MDPPLVQRSPTECGASVVQNLQQRIGLVQLELSSHENKTTTTTTKEKYLLILNHSKPTGYVMHQKFNIQQLYVLPTQYLCVLYLSENKQRLVPLTA